MLLVVLLYSYVYVINLMYYFVPGEYSLLLTKIVIRLHFQWK